MIIEILCSVIAMTGETSIRTGHGKYFTLVCSHTCPLNGFSLIIFIQQVFSFMLLVEIFFLFCVLFIVGY